MSIRTVIISPISACGQKNIRQIKQMLRYSRETNPLIFPVKSQSQIEHLTKYRGHRFIFPRVKDLRIGENYPPDYTQHINDGHIYGRYTKSMEYMILATKFIKNENTLSFMRENLDISDLYSINWIIFTNKISGL
jgi:hypothetical protein